ncbi:hypothetical protein NFI96_010768 [Prochilodus magdalenae]|nr:hypothetical protein NFI96_010768 [Prochilodus magdalenae]
MAAICQAIQAAFLLLVCGLVQCTDCTCNVTCTTDYISTLNCSASASEGPVSCDVEAECSDEFDSVNGSCVIRPPHQWCIIQPKDFYQMVSIDTKCTLKVKQSNPQQDTQDTTQEVTLCNIIKPQQPFNLTLTKSNGDFNLSWEMAYQLDGGLDGELKYRVLVRPKDDLDGKHSMEFNIVEDRRYQEIRCELFSSEKVYVAFVQASVNSRTLPSNYWSEWTSSAEWQCPNADSSALTGPYLSFLLLLVVFVVGLLIYFRKQGYLKKLGPFQYIPNPQNFFKPLYHTYQGDFKKWVGPVLPFNSIDILEKSVPLQVLTEKQLASLPLQRELLQEPLSGGSSLGDWSLLSLVNPSSSKRYFLGSSSLGTSRSSGHISMDTVTVSGQEGTMSDWTEGNSRHRSDAGFHGIGQRAPGVSDEDDLLGLGGGEDAEELQSNDMYNIEEISLDSYSSNEHSDDGYPQMGLDLDTIDSGFLESDCSSPMNSECDGSEQIEAALPFYVNAEELCKCHMLQILRFSDHVCSIHTQPRDLVQGHMRMVPLHGILYAFLTITQLHEAKSQAQENLTCVTDYWITIDCFLKSTAIPNTSGNTSYWLEFDFENQGRVYNCSLTVAKDGYTCTFKALNLLFQTSFLDYNYFVISLCYLGNGLKKSVLDSKYFPSKHIKPLTPSNLTVGKADGQYIFQWTSGYENHEYYQALPFQYKLAYHKEGYPGDVLIVHVTGTQFNVSETQFEPDTQYTAMVCNDIQNGSRYVGICSHWSTNVKWKTPFKEGNPTVLPFAAVLGVMICLGISFLLLYPAARMKIKEIIWVTTPPPNFQSLFQNHQSHFKDWAHKSQMQQTYCEEISKIDEIAEITAVEQNQGKISSMYFTPQYQTPYVGPSAEVWAPLQISDTHSVASISCKDHDFIPEDSAAEEPMLCLTAFEPISLEGFLCMEDLELSHEDLEPTETLTVTPKPECLTQNCFNQNYCTLTNTSIGLIPTFTMGPCKSELVPADRSLKEPLIEQTEENTSELITLTLDCLELSMDD